MKVTDLKNNECIHCETEEQANAICKLMHEAGLKWRFGGSYLVNKRNYHNICFYPKSGEHDSLKYAIERNHTIYKAEQFLTQETETMQTKKAEEYAKEKSSSSVFAEAHKKDFLVGYKQALKDSKAPEMLEMLKDIKDYLGSDVRMKVDKLIKEATEL